MKIYYLKTCDTCRKALKALPDAARQEIRAAPVTRDELEAWLNAVGADVLVNRKSTTWRGLNEAERAAAPIELLLAHPTLMKRPVIVDGAAVYVGWTPPVRAALGL